ncbi:MAG: hypothetical protein R3181_13310, partial [Rubricoccaceae bacterium]|nr:hypothetical protein [Rubricoccaceae bacterium]
MHTPDGNDVPHSPGAPATGSYAARPDPAIDEAVYVDLETVDPSPRPAVGEVFVEAPLVVAEEIDGSAPGGDGSSGGATAPDVGFSKSEGFKIGFDDAPAGGIVPLPPRRLPALPGAGVEAAAPTPLQPRYAFRDRAEVLFRYRRLVAGVVVACVLGALLYGLFAPRQYAASSVLLISTSRPAGAQEALVGDFIDVPGMGEANAPWWVVGCVGLAFLLAGLMVGVSGVRGILHRRRRAAPARDRRDGPWMRDYPWT